MVSCGAGDMFPTNAHGRPGKDRFMDGYALLALKDALQFAFCAGGCWYCWNTFVWVFFGFWDPVNFVGWLNQLFVQVSSLIGTLGCAVAAFSIFWKNFSGTRKQIFEDIRGNATDILKMQDQLAEKDRRVSALTLEAAAARSLAEDAAKAKAADAVRIADLERKIKALHETTRRNTSVVVGLKMESDLRKSTPDPDRPPSRVEIVNTAEHPVPTVASLPPPEHPVPTTAAGKPPHD